MLKHVFIYEMNVILSKMRQFKDYNGKLEQEKPEKFKKSP